MTFAISAFYLTFFCGKSDGETDAEDAAGDRGYERPS